MSAGALEWIESIPAVDDHGVFVEGAGSRPVDDEVVEVYRYAARRGSLSLASLDEAAAELGLPAHAVFSAVAQLVELRLLRTDAGAGGRLVPVEREFAATMLISPIERAIYQRRELADRLRERIDTITRPPFGAQEPIGSIDGLEGAAEIRGLFKLASEVCRDELVVMRPGHDDEEMLDELLDTCYSVLDRGVSVRVICPHSSRAGFASRAKAKRLVEGGAEIRTLSQVPQAAVVFDRSLAVMFSVPSDGGLPVARRVRDEKVVRFLIDLFDQLWGGATLFASDEPGYAEAVGDLQESLARLMAQGLTDEVVARRLGMSVRTCRRHIAALLHNLDSVSRFQAGVQAAHRLTIEGARGA